MGTQTIHFCDRCKKTTGSLVLSVEINDGYSIATTELCGECAVALRKWLASPNKKEEGTRA
jgi:hypothetical protein